METRVRQKKSGEETGEMELNALWHAIAEGENSLGKILEELREFRKKNNEKIADIKQDLNSTNKRIEEAEGRIAEAKEQIQQTGEVLLKLLAQLEAKLTDQEDRIIFIRIYRVPEGGENGSLTIKLIKKLLKDGT
ncbi:hypothetical protein ABG768_019247 [Culter alburnus]|uniref:Uncharacterized protein n=1 Tax=Culter alburnus TaxID=194366 RepID=A0AAW2AWG6_CULAL